MSTITDVQVMRFKEAENKRHMSEMRKMKTENATEYHNEALSNEKMIDRMRNDFESKSRIAESDLERQLADMRRKHEKRMEQENQRLDEELKNLKATHQDQVAEIKNSNTNEIQNIRESHERTIANAKEKFIREKTKWEA
tara:strand:+ start:321 stop:740 length:420 start_codon:yes stop_codon:yes gene_type:complete